MGLEVSGWDVEWLVDDHKAELTKKKNFMNFNFHIRQQEVAEKISSE